MRFRAKLRRWLPLGAALAAVGMVFYGYWAWQGGRGARLAAAEKRSVRALDSSIAALETEAAKRRDAGSQAQAAAQAEAARIAAEAGGLLKSRLEAGQQDACAEGLGRTIGRLAAFFAGQEAKDESTPEALAFGDTKQLRALIPAGGSLAVRSRTGARLWEAQSSNAQEGGAIQSSREFTFSWNGANQAWKVEASLPAPDSANQAVPLDATAIGKLLSANSEVAAGLGEGVSIFLLDQRGRMALAMPPAAAQVLAERELMPDDNGRWMGIPSSLGAAGMERFISASTLNGGWRIAARSSVPEAGAGAWLWGALSSNPLASTLLALFWLLLAGLAVWLRLPHKPAQEPLPVRQPTLRQLQRQFHGGQGNRVFHLEARSEVLRELLSRVGPVPAGQEGRHV